MFGSPVDTHLQLVCTKAKETTADPNTQTLIQTPKRCSSSKHPNIQNRNVDPNTQTLIQTPKHFGPNHHTILLYYYYLPQAQEATTIVKLPHRAQLHKDPHPDFDLCRRWKQDYTGKSGKQPYFRSLFFTKYFRVYWAFFRLFATAYRGTQKRFKTVDSCALGIE
jgi:hypothetical protein